MLTPEQNEKLYWHLINSRSKSPLANLFIDNLTDEQRAAFVKMLELGVL